MARCASCHRPDGPAFSLLTYGDARPWARAISEEVLERRMPPWGAVKGFGEFRNEQSLTQTELETLAQWVDGGAPEGDAEDLPRPSATHRPADFAAKRLATIEGEFALRRPVTLEGLEPETVDGASMRITAELPGGRVEPLVWLYRYDVKRGHRFLFRKPLRLPAGTTIHGVPKGSRVALLGH
jgi:hypothetical protein